MVTGDLTTYGTESIAAGLINWKKKERTLIAAGFQVHMY